MVMGVNGQDGQNFARAHANTEIDQPAETVTKGRLTQRHAPQQAGRIDADDCQSYHPIDEGLRARGVLDAKGEGQETQDARDGAKSEAGLSKELQGQQDQVHLRQDGHALLLALELMQTRQGFFEGMGGSVPLGANANDLCALVSIAVTSLRGFVFPLMSTGCDFGELTHAARALIYPYGLWPWGSGRVEMKMIP
jgi:hypothetical protein